MKQFGYKFAEAQEELRDNPDIIPFIQEDSILAACKRLDNYYRIPIADKPDFPEGQIYNDIAKIRDRLIDEGINDAH